MTIVSERSMKSKRGIYIPKVNENINYGERTLKGGSSCRPLGLLQKRLDAMPSHSKIILYRRVFLEIMIYRREFVNNDRGVLDYE
jgi:hypothetical protein